MKIAALLCSWETRCTHLVHCSLPDWTKSHVPHFLSPFIQSAHFFSFFFFADPFVHVWTSVCFFETRTCPLLLWRKRVTITCSSCCWSAIPALAKRAYCSSSPTTLSTPRSYPRSASTLKSKPSNFRVGRSSFRYGSFWTMNSGWAGPKWTKHPLTLIPIVMYDD